MKRLDIESTKQKNSEARGQKIAYITTDEFERVKEYLTESEESTGVSNIQPNVGGMFYLIQLEPDYHPGRFKVGFATNIEERLRTHKTVAPFSKVLKTWPCKLLWEKTAIECVSQGCEQIHTEVFFTDSIDEVIARCEEFFKMMPKLSTDE